MEPFVSGLLVICLKQDGFPNSSKLNKSRRRAGCRHTCHHLLWLCFITAMCSSSFSIHQQIISPFAAPVRSGRTATLVPNGSCWVFRMLVSAWSQSISSRLNFFQSLLIFLHKSLNSHLMFAFLLTAKSKIPPQVCVFDSCFSSRWFYLPWEANQSL